MATSLQKYCRLFTVGISAALNISIAAIPTKAELFNCALDRLPATERVALRQGKSLVTGSNGKYIGKVLVTATPAIAWQVLTDYNNFYHFLPNVVSSKLVQNDRDRKVFEQIQIFRAFRSRKKPACELLSKKLTLNKLLLVLSKAI